MRKIFVFTETIFIQRNKDVAVFSKLGLKNILNRSDCWERTFLIKSSNYARLLYFYSSLGFLMDAIWLVIVVVFAWRVLSSEYYRTVVRPADPAWNWLQDRFAMPYRAQLALYRAFFFYGASRTIAWTIWVHVITGSSWDLRWGGPSWVAPFQPW